MPVEVLAGAATREGTRRGAESFGSGARVLGRTGLTVSPVGFGGYRVRDDSALHRRSLADALRAGVNLVDTSTNYGDGRSELLTGGVLAHLVQQGELRREHVVVVSKVGYVQGSNLQRVRARGPLSEVVEVAPDCWHCIHPDFVAAQLEESLERLGLERLDVLLLHNPEYFLLDAADRNTPVEAARAEYERRLEAAFQRLEGLVREGRIAWYGVSSNTFVDPPDSPAFTSLARCVELARRVGGEGHRLGVVQMPMNLLELGAALQRSDTPHGPLSPLAVAAREDLGVLVNRPLNAIVRRDGRERLVRLADVASPEERGAIEDARRALAAVRKLEATWATGLGQRLRTEDGQDDAVDLFRWGQELSSSLPAIRDLEQWQRLRHEIIAPHLGQTARVLLGALQGAAHEEFKAWWTRYGTALHEAFVAIERGLTSTRQGLAAAVAQRLDPHLPAPWRSLPLSRKAVLTLLSTPVSSVLVGMRQPGYVQDIAALRDHPVRLSSAATGPVDLNRLAADLAQIGF